jgi:predicted metalloprotease with PDZ domain
VAQASFDAWTKYYRSDENTPNATVNYYTKGALVALAFDLTLRSEGPGTLDDVMRAMWVRAGYGGNAGPDSGDRLVEEADVARALRDVGGRSYEREVRAWVHGTDDLPLEPLLARAGVTWSTETPTATQRLGVRVSEGALSGVQIKQVLRGSPAERAGLAAGDELLAANGWRLRRLDDAFASATPGAPIELLAARDQRVFAARIDVEPPGAGAVALMPSASAAAAALALRKGWLGA